MKVLKLFAFMAVCLLMAACGSDGASEVVEKIKGGEALTQSDYTVMVDYCGRYAEEAQKIQDQINNLPAESEQTFDLENKMTELSNKFPYTAEFFDKIANCTKEEVGEKNVEKINRYAPLMWFSAPSWAIVGTDTDVAGFIEDMPATDSAGVISEGDGVVVDK